MEKQQEIWKPVEFDFDSIKIEVSNLGRVRELGGGLRSINDNGYGYKTANVYNRDTRKVMVYYVHRLVALTFIGEPPEGKTQINHKDGDKENNAVDNLEWVSAKENIRHMHEEGLNTNRIYHGKLVRKSDEIVAKAYFEIVSGNLGVAESARKYGMPRTTMSSIVNKYSRKDVTNFIDYLVSSIKIAEVCARYKTT